MVLIYHLMKMSVFWIVPHFTKKGTKMKARKEMKARKKMKACKTRKKIKVKVRHEGHKGTRDT